MQKTNLEGYLAPELEVLKVTVEQGFSQSTLEDPVENPEQDWK